MLCTATIERLDDLRLSGMAQALREQNNTSGIDELSFEERLGLLVDRELSTRADRQLKRRLKQATLRQSAAMADLDYRRTRGLDKLQMLTLASCEWIRRHQNIVITGATGVGKSFVASALAHSACLEGYSAQYWRLSRLVEDLQLARADGRYLRVLKQLARVDLLVLDDWGLARLSSPQQSDMLELLDDRHQRRSTIVTSQFPVNHWHEAMADPTLADAILDRLVHNAHHLKLKGESMRKLTADLEESVDMRS
jgi:DNA replication protein DnaC